MSLAALAKILGIRRDLAEDALHSQSAAKAVLSRRDLFAAGAALTAGTLFSQVGYMNILLQVGESLTGQTFNVPTTVTCLGNNSIIRCEWTAGAPVGQTGLVIRGTGMQFVSDSYFDGRNRSNFYTGAPLS